LIHVDDHAFARIGTQFNDPRIHPDGIFRTGLNTEATKDANTQLNIKHLGHLFDVRIRIWGGYDVDAARRTYSLAHHAGNTSGRSVFPLREPMSGSQSRGKGAPLLRIFNGYGFTFSHPETNAARQVPGKVAEKMSRRQEQTASHFRYIKPFKKPKGPFFHIIPMIAKSAHTFKAQ
jgi:hypothetical protein